MLRLRLNMYVVSSSVAIVVEKVNFIGCHRTYAHVAMEPIIVEIKSPPYYYNFYIYIYIYDIFIINNYNLKSLK